MFNLRAFDDLVPFCEMKEIDHSKMKIMLSLTHPYVVPIPWWPSSKEHKRIHKVCGCLFHAVEIAGVIQKTQ